MEKLGPDSSEAKREKFEGLHAISSSCLYVRTQKTLPISWQKMDEIILGGNDDPNIE